MRVWVVCGEGYIEVFVNVICVVFCWLGGFIVYFGVLMIFVVIVILVNY